MYKHTVNSYSWDIADPISSSMCQNMLKKGCFLSKVFPICLFGAYVVSAVHISYSFGHLHLGKPQLTPRGFHLRKPRIFHGTQFLPLIERQMLLQCTKRLHIPQNTVWRSPHPGFAPTDISDVSAFTLASSLIPELLGGFCQI